MLEQKSREVAADPVEVTTARWKASAVLGAQLAGVVIADAPAHHGEGAFERRPEGKRDVVAVDGEVARRQHRTFGRRVAQRGCECALHFTQRDHAPLPGSGPRAGSRPPGPPAPEY